MDFKEFLFPFDEVRKYQEDLILLINSCIEEKRHLVVNAPTGLGKTVSALGPALKHALEKNLTVIFVTPRHTQHKIAIDTVNAIREKFNIKIGAVDLIGKRWLCPVPGIENLYSRQFYEFCNSQKEEEKCIFYKNTRKPDAKLTPEAQAAAGELGMKAHHAQEVCELCNKKNLCAYEVSCALASKANVIVADYHHIFNEHIRNMFLKKAGKELKDCIIIIDEGHNVPDRVRELMSGVLSTYMLKSAEKEAKEKKFNETANLILGIKKALDDVSEDVEGEDEVEKVIFKKLVEKYTNSEYSQLIGDLAFIADEVKEEKKQSSIGGIAKFLEAWQNSDDSYARFVRKTENRVELFYKCLDPSIVTSGIIEESFCTIIMSGTLEPAQMYKDLLGFPENTVSASLKSPFKKENQLNLIVPKTTTKFTERSEGQIAEIAKICREVSELIPGNCAIFFPSYELRDKTSAYLMSKVKKTIFIEAQGMKKAERDEFLEKFKSYKDSGAVLLGVVSGSFGEGIDLPGDMLNGVVIVGVPLKKPDFETKKLIAYYDGKFGKGWDYGYSMPAMTKAIQGAGRCIRSETDKGVIVFLDKRFTMDIYYNVFPKHWDIKVTELYSKWIKDFFSTKK